MPTIPTYKNAPAQLRTDRKGYPVELWIVHETAGSAPGDLNFLRGGPRSVTWYIAPNGEISLLAKMQPDGTTDATAHAGVCAWGKYKPTDGFYGINPASGKNELLWGWANLASEGVEVSGPNDGTPFSRQQVESLLNLTLWRIDVLRLGLDRVVRHLDVAWPKNRKSDPKGLNWSWFIAELQRRQKAEGAKTIVVPPKDPTNETTLRGPSGDLACSVAVRNFYNAHGGLAVFGFPLKAEYTAADSQGETCGWMPCELGIIKRKPSNTLWPVRLAPLAEYAGHLP